MRNNMAAAIEKDVQESAEHLDETSVTGTEEDIGRKGEDQEENTVTDTAGENLEPGEVALGGISRKFNPLNYNFADWMDLYLRFGREKIPPRMSELSGKKEEKERKKNLVMAFRQTGGLVTSACEMVGSCSATFRKYYETDPIFAEMVDHIQEREIDFSETQLKRNIKDGKEASLIFHLKTKGRSRGYVERVEHNMEGKIGFYREADKIPLEELQRIAQMRVLPAFDPETETPINTIEVKPEEQVDPEKKPLDARNPDAVDSLDLDTE